MTNGNESEFDPAKAADQLVADLQSYGRVAVAFSAGVDSTVVAKAAQLALGERALAVTGASASLAEGALEAARSLAKLIGIRHEVIATEEFADPAYVRNDGSRCYFCKSELYDRLQSLAEEWGFDIICSGANLDDWGDYRPGLQAAAERAVRHPLQEAHLTKRMVRELARYWGLPNWDQPATPCLSSRMAVGVEVTSERVRMVDRAERYLSEQGISPVRVRYHAGDHARVEVPLADLTRLVEAGVREQLVEYLLELGFKFVSLDLAGFRSGSLNVMVPAKMLKAAPKPQTDPHGSD